MDPNPKLISIQQRTGSVLQIRILIPPPPCLKRREHKAGLANKNGLSAYMLINRHGTDSLSQLITILPFSFLLIIFLYNYNYITMITIFIRTPK